MICGALPLSPRLESADCVAAQVPASLRGVPTHTPLLVLQVWTKHGVSSDAHCGVLVHDATKALLLPSTAHGMQMRFKELLTIA